MKQDVVMLKGNKWGIEVILDSQKPFDDILNCIRNKFLASSGFFSDVGFTIGFKGRELKQKEKEIISDTITEIIGENVKFNFSTFKRKEVVNNKSLFNEIKEGITKFYKGTVRSGQLIEAKNNLVIIGHVNPGAEVIAAGNIIVLGYVRGIVHAGYCNNKNAIVAGLTINPTQLSIGNIIARSPDGKKNDEACESIPEIAYVKEDKIYIDYHVPKEISCFY